MLKDECQKVLWARNDPVRGYASATDRRRRRSTRRSPPSMAGRVPYRAMCTCLCAAMLDRGVCALHTCVCACVYELECAQVCIHVSVHASVSKHVHELSKLHFSRHQFAAIFFSGNDSNVAAAITKIHLVEIDLGRRQVTRLELGVQYVAGTSRCRRGLRCDGLTHGDEVVGSVFSVVTVAAEYMQSIQIYMRTDMQHGRGGNLCQHSKFCQHSCLPHTSSIKVLMVPLMSSLMVRGALTRITT